MPPLSCSRHPQRRNRRTGTNPLKSPIRTRLRPEPPVPALLAPLPWTDIRRPKGGPGARKELSSAPPDFAGKVRALTRTGPRSSLRPGAQMEVLGDRYRVERELGHGGMGRVFVAHDLKLDREVALKVLSSGEHDAHDVVRLEQEARAAGALEPPNVVAVTTSGRTAALLSSSPSCCKDGRCGRRSVTETCPCRWRSITRGSSPMASRPHTPRALSIAI